MNNLSNLRVLLSAGLCLSIMLFATVAKAQSCSVGSSYQGQYTADYTAGPELYPKVDGAVKSRFLMRVGWVIIVHVYFTRPTDRRIV